MILLLALILLVLALVFVVFPRFAWYYVLSGKWGRNGMGAPSNAQIMAIRIAGILPIIAVRCFMLG